MLSLLFVSSLLCSKATSQDIAAEKIWGKLFNRTRTIPSVLPANCPSLRIFVYNLPDEFHLDLIRSVEDERKGSSCDWARSQCIELKRNGYYSLYRQHAAEVPILAKFLSLHQTSNVTEADFLVVPFLASTAHFAVWEFHEGVRIKRLYTHLMEHQLHFKGKLATRHIFLSTFNNMVVPINQIGADMGAIVLTLGPILNPSDVVVVANDAQFGYPLVENLTDAENNELLYTTVSLEA
jgi:hypothetical protein